MKYIVSLLLIISLVGIAVFIPTLFEHNMHGLDNNCVSSAIDGTVCPTSIIGMILHHISIVQMFMTITPSSSNWLLLLVSILLISVSIYLFYKNLLLPKFNSLPQRLRDLTLHSFYSRRKIVSWFSLLELSPAL